MSHFSYLFRLALLISKIRFRYNLYHVHYRPTLDSLGNQLFDKCANYDAFWDRKQNCIQGYFRPSALANGFALS